MESLPLIINAISVVGTAVSLGAVYGKMTQRMKTVEDNAQRQEEEIKELKIKVEAASKENQNLTVAFTEVRIEVRQLIEAVKVLQERVMRKK